MTALRRFIAIALFLVAGTLDAQLRPSGVLSAEMALNLRPSFELIETYNFYIEQANKSQAFRLREQRLATLAGILSAGLIVTGAVLLSEGSVTENTGLTVAGSLGLGAGVGLIPRPFAHLRDASAAAARERRSLANAAALGLTPVNPDLQ